MAEHALPIKTMGDALAMRSHIIQQLEKAEVAPTSELKKEYLTFLIIGGGFSGTEVAGEINDFARISCRYYRDLSPEDVNVTLIHSRDLILPEIGDSLRRFAMKKMEKAGIHFVMNARATSVTADGVRLKDGRDLKGNTIVTTVGNVPSPLIQTLRMPTIEGALETEPDMRVKSQANAWAIGDCAWIINAYDGKPCPGTAQFAERQGKQAAKNILRVLRNEPTKPFSHRSQGQLCSIGGKRAVAEIFGFQLSGFWAWFVWRGVYLFKMPTWSRRIKIGFDWAWDLVFHRDQIYIKPDQTERVSSAYYDPGDFIFRQGDPALGFYAIEEGEVEVVRQDAAGKESIIAVLKPGEFFGEMALLDKRAHSAGVRARTGVRVIVMGRDMFAQLSGSLASVRALVADVAKKRKLSVPA
jgi:NADH dehydrogenase